MKKELSEFEQIMAQSGSVGLQTDTMAELESTLSIASEIAVFRSNRYVRTSSCSTKDDFPYKRTLRNESINLFKICFKV